MNQNTIQRYGYLLRWSALSLLILLTGLSGSATAQGGVTWSEPVNLSNSPTGSVHPAIVADAYGYVHVFWSEDMNGEFLGRDRELDKTPNTIMYRRWDGASWSEPVDVLAVPGEDVAEYIDVAIDPAGTIHATWTAQNRIYYASVPAREAGNVHAWTRPVGIAADNARSMRESSIAVTPSGDIHVIYATRGENTGVYHVSLGAGGALRGAPVTISAPLTSLERGYANVRLISDGAGRLHATWQSFEKDGYGQGVYYSHSFDDGSSWSMPELFRYKGTGDKWVELPYLLAAGDADLYLVYVDGTNVARAFRVSRDSGATWSEPKTILADLEGINGYMPLVADDAGQVHIIGPMRTRADQLGAIYYSALRGDNFIPATPIVLDGHSVTSGSMHYPAAAVRLGNEIYLVWNEIGGSEIWYAKGTINGLAPIPVQPTPTAPAPVAAEVQATGAPATTTPEPNPTPEDAPDRLPAELAAVPSQTTAAWTPLVAAIVPVSLLLAGVAAWQIRRR